MNVKKEAMERIVKVLEREKREIECREYQNKANMGRLVAEQTIIKREKAAIHNLLRELKTKN